MVGSFAGYPAAEMIKKEYDKKECYEGTLVQPLGKNSQMFLFFFKKESNLMKVGFCSDFGPSFQFYF